MARRRGPTPPAPWDPLVRTELEPGALEAFAAAGVTPPDEVWGSRLFSVIVRYARVDDVRQKRSELLWLSIHRRDRKAIRDWRHMQSIKNDVAGADRVGVEVYPAEADLVDAANEYHIWVLPVGFVLPFGFGSGGLLMTPEEVAAGADGAVQRAWDPGLPTGPDRIGV